MLNRRSFVQGLAGGALLQGASPGLFGATPLRELQGPNFDLTIDTLPVNYTGTSRHAVVSRFPGAQPSAMRFSFSPLS